jgi:hypothetical protein
MTEDKMVELTDRLIAKTREGELAWHVGLRPGSLTVSFPRHTIEITPDGLNRLVLTVQNGEGEIIVRTSANHFPGVEEARYVVPEEKLHELYEAAQESTEAELDQLLEELRHSAA